jgi:hypothetical protein
MFSSKALAFWNALERKITSTAALLSFSPPALWDWR